MDPLTAGTGCRRLTIHDCDHVLQRTYDASTSTLWSVCVVLRSGRTSMGLMIVFTCPHTGHDVSSGVLVMRRP